jgi:hypothetical protein
MRAKSMTVKELKEMLKATDICDDMEIILHNNVGAPPVTEPEFFITTTERGLCVEIMPGREIK